MNVLYNTEKLVQLITSLQSFTGIRTNTFDANGRDIQLSGGHSRFCQLINASAEGHARCEGCDMKASEESFSCRGAYSYRCHAGVCETVVPVFDSGEPVAFLVFGQLLDDSPVKLQWEAALKTLDWYKGDLDELKAAFFDLRRMPRRDMEAYSEILEAVSNYIRQQGIIVSAEYTDIQRLEKYLDEHYTEKLTLKKISADLRIGTTKLCALAKKMSGGSTLMQIIAQRRVDEAKRLLVKNDESVSSVAEKVGFTDYNYFTKIFKNLTGVPPRRYRREARGWNTEAAER